jgi:prefoldin subunit 5
MAKQQGTPMTSLEQVVHSLSKSIQGIANPNNSTEDKIDEIENALRDIQAALQMIADAAKALA